MTHRSFGSTNVKKESFKKGAKEVTTLGGSARSFKKNTRGFSKEQKRGK